MAVPAESVQADELPRYSPWQIVGYWPKQRTFGLGGPLALIGFKHRDLVEERG